MRNKLDKWEIIVVRLHGWLGRVPCVCIVHSGGTRCLFFFIFFLPFFSSASFFWHWDEKHEVSEISFFCVMRSWLFCLIGRGRSLSGSWEELCRIVGQGMMMMMISKLLSDVHVAEKLYWWIFLVETFHFMIALHTYCSCHQSVFCGLFHWPRAARSKSVFPVFLASASLFCNSWWQLKLLAQCHQASWIRTEWGLRAYARIDIPKASWGGRDRWPLVK